MTKKQHTKAQLLAEALGTTAEEAKLFGDQVNAILSRRGLQAAAFGRISEVISANSGNTWGAVQVADVLARAMAQPTAKLSAVTPPDRREKITSPTKVWSDRAGTTRIRLSEADDAELAKFRQAVAANSAGVAVIDNAGSAAEKAKRSTIASTPPLDSEESAIRQFVAEREIPYLVHLTTIENFRGICREQAILSVVELAHRNLKYEQFDTARLDGQRNFINCSVGYFNFHMFYGAVSKAYTHDVLIFIRPDYLWYSETRFCPVNASTDRGRRVGSGLEALRRMYQERVDDKVGSQNRDHKPLWLPTSIQAEVLVNRHIPISDVLKVVVRSKNRLADVENAGWTGKTGVHPKYFEYRDVWISKQYAPWSFTID